MVVATLASLEECPTCTKALVSSNLEDNQNLLCFFKVYNSEETNFGGLNAPSPFSSLLMSLQPRNIGQNPVLQVSGMNSGRYIPSELLQTGGIWGAKCKTMVYGQNMLVLPLFTYIMDYIQIMFYV